MNLRWVWSKRGIIGYIGVIGSFVFTVLAAVVAALIMNEQQQWMPVLANVPDKATQSLVSLATYPVPLWLGLLIAIAQFVLTKAIKKRQHGKRRPACHSYTEAVICGVLCRWAYEVMPYDGKEHISNITWYCQHCDYEIGRLESFDYHRLSTVCPSCNETAYNPEGASRSNFPTSNFPKFAEKEIQRLIRVKWPRARNGGSA